MPKYAIHLNVRVEIEAENDSAAENILWGGDGDGSYSGIASLAHYIHGVDVITDVEQHGTPDLIED